MLTTDTHQPSRVICATARLRVLSPCTTSTTSWAVPLSSCNPSNRQESIWNPLQFTTYHKYRLSRMQSTRQILPIPLEVQKLSASTGLRLHDALTRCCARGACWRLSPAPTAIIGSSYGACHRPLIRSFLPITLMLSECAKLPDGGRDVKGDKRPVTGRNVKGRKYVVSHLPQHWPLI